MERCGVCTIVTYIVLSMGLFCPLSRFCTDRLDEEEDIGSWEQSEDVAWLYGKQEECIVGHFQNLPAQRMPGVAVVVRLSIWRQE